MSTGVKAARERPRILENLLGRLAGSPDAYVQKFDLVNNAAMIIEFGADAYRAASFLDDRILKPGMKGGWASIASVIEAMRATRNQRPLCFIFHSGHVGSTLVSRLLDETGVVQPLREPLPLRLLADAHDARGRPDSLLGELEFDALLDAFLRLSARGYGGTTHAVLKATSSAGRLAPVLLDQRPEARAICLNLRAEPYLTTLLSRENSRTDLRGHGPERMRRLQGFGVIPPAPLHRLSSGELAAMGWLVETWSHRTALQAGGERVAVVDFDRLLGDVPGEMGRIARHFGIACAPEAVAAMAQSPVLTRYAKAPEHAYSPELRAEILADSRARNAGEIRKGLAWLEGVARANAGAAAVMQASG